MDNNNNNNNNACMTAVCTEHAAPEAQHVADQRINNAETTAAFNSITLMYTYNYIEIT